MSTTLPPAGRSLLPPLFLCDVSSRSPVFKSRALTCICEKTVQTTSDPSKNEMACLEEVHITNVRPGEGLVSQRGQRGQRGQQL